MYTFMRCRCPQSQPKKRCCPPHHQHLSNRGTACCTQTSICSMMIYSSKYSITIV
ncbi:hypothetical protein BJV78DRAFT_1209802 [Lactifluus subvellereus]|nr:hypothetical protein BJV78DRAFT_1209802 [Lactifluus subvellereus]